MKFTTQKDRANRLAMRIPFTDRASPKTVIPPLSEVRFIKIPGTWGYIKSDLGRTVRIGYYRPRDGLNCVWLVDDQGVYFGTVTQKIINSHFEVIDLSSETDLFGIDRDVIGPC
jgi:hypothetical protein